jgi:hypothetical protein
MNDKVVDAAEKSDASLRNSSCNANRTMQEPEALIDPLSSLSQQRMCSVCRPSQSGLSAELGSMPFPARRLATMSLQKSLGNKFVQGLAVQAKSGPNRTGMPDQLKLGIERISGMDLSAVRVHYGSSKPAEINALAYTQGQEIHVATGQEEHLPHEAWHAVQQMQGRVKPTVQMKDGISLNDDEDLEHEADVMGAEALVNAVQLQGATEEQKWSQDNFAEVRCRQIARDSPTVQRQKGVVQRKVEHDGNKYVGNGDRAAWRAVLKKYVIQDYNQRTGSNLSMDVDLSEKELDRCHKVSFNDIENLVVNYLNSIVSDLDFILLTNELIKDPKQKLQMQKYRSFLMYVKKTGQIYAIVQQANALLSVLNSAIGNVMLGNARINRSIQEQLDFHFKKTISGDYSLTPQSRNLAEKWAGYTSGIPYTPYGQHIKSSSSGLVPVGSLTPKTDALIKDI